MLYICAECGEKNEIALGQIVSCRSCGNRILYKNRTKDVLVYEARLKSIAFGIPDIKKFKNKIQKFFFGRKEENFHFETFPSICPKCGTKNEVAMDSTVFFCSFCGEQLFHRFKKKENLAFRIRR